MAKTLSPVCKLCRREGEKLYLKGERCFTPKCSFEKRSFRPRAAWQDRQPRRRQSRTGRESDFARQLRAKQKARRIYGVLERQFRRYYETALGRRGLTGLNLLQILESRLDNVVFRLGFASSRAQARLLVTHGHFTVNGRRTDVPSMLLKEGDADRRPRRLRQPDLLQGSGRLAEKRNSPAWLSRDLKQMCGAVRPPAGTR